MSEEIIMENNNNNNNNNPSNSSGKIKMELDSKNNKFNVINDNLNNYRGNGNINVKQEDGYGVLGVVSSISPKPSGNNENVGYSPLKTGDNRGKNDIKNINSKNFKFNWKDYNKKSFGNFNNKNNNNNNSSNSLGNYYYNNNNKSERKGNFYGRECEDSEMLNGINDYNSEIDNILDRVNKIKREEEKFDRISKEIKMENINDLFNNKSIKNDNEINSIVKKLKNEKNEKFDVILHQTKRDFINEVNIYKNDIKLKNLMVENLERENSNLRKENKRFRKEKYILIDCIKELNGIIIRLEDNIIILRKKLDYSNRIIEKGKNNNNNNVLKENYLELYECYKEEKEKNRLLVKLLNEKNNKYDMLQQQAQQDRMNGFMIPGNTRGEFIKKHAIAHNKDRPVLYPMGNIGNGNNRENSIVWDRIDDRVNNEPYGGHIPQSQSPPPPQIVNNNNNNNNNNNVNEVKENNENEEKNNELIMERNGNNIRVNLGDNVLIGNGIIERENNNILIDSEERKERLREEYNLDYLNNNRVNINGNNENELIGNFRNNIFREFNEFNYNNNIIRNNRNNNNNNNNPNDAPQASVPIEDIVNNVRNIRNNRNNRNNRRNDERIVGNGGGGGDGGDSPTPSDHRSDFSGRRSISDSIEFMNGRNNNNNNNNDNLNRNNFNNNNNNNNLEKILKNNKLRIPNGVYYSGKGDIIKFIDSIDGWKLSNKLSEDTAFVQVTQYALSSQVMQQLNYENKLNNNKIISWKELRKWLFNRYELKGSLINRKNRLYGFKYYYNFSSLDNIRFLEGAHQLYLVHLELEKECNNGNNIKIIKINELEIIEVFISSMDFKDKLRIKLWEKYRKGEIKKIIDVSKYILENGRFKEELDNIRSGLLFDGKFGKRWNNYYKNNRNNKNYNFRKNKGYNNYNKNNNRKRNNRNNNKNKKRLETVARSRRLNGKSINYIKNKKFKKNKNNKKKNNNKKSLKNDNLDKVRGKSASDKDRKPSNLNSKDNKEVNNKLEVIGGKPVSDKDRKSSNQQIKEENEIENKLDNLFIKELYCKDLEDNIKVYLDSGAHLSLCSEKFYFKIKRLYNIKRIKCKGINIKTVNGYSQVNEFFSLNIRREDGIDILVDIYPVKEEFDKYDILLERNLFCDFGNNIIKSLENEIEEEEYKLERGDYLFKIENNVEDDMIFDSEYIDKVNYMKYCNFIEVIMEKKERLKNYKNKFKNINLVEESMDSFEKENKDLEFELDDIKLDIGNENNKKELLELLDEYKTGVFAQHRFDLGRIKDYKLDIKLRKDYKIINESYYPLRPGMDVEVKKQLNMMLKKGIIKPSHSRWSSPAFTIRHKSGEVRIVVNYKKVNKEIMDKPCPIRPAAEMIRNCKGCKVYSILDLRHGYHQMEIDENSKDILAFSTPFGQYTWNRVPLGIKTAPGYFQEMMVNILLDFDFVEVYLDNIYIRSKNEKDHKIHLKKVLDRLMKYNIKLNIKKCEFYKNEIDYLGYKVNGEGWDIDKKRREEIFNFRTPINVKELEKFLGLVQFVGMFIPGLQTDAEPLNRLKRKDIKWEWKSPQQEAFDNIKNKILGAKPLHHPDFRRPFIIKADASDVGIGGVLLQIQKGKLFPIEFWSKSFNKHQRNWGIEKRELYSIIMCLEKWRTMIINTSTTVLNDHRNLLNLMEKKHPTAMQARWIARLSEFDFKIGYIKGLNNRIADYLSRAFSKNKENKILKVYYIMKLKDKNVNIKMDCNYINKLGDNIFNIINPNCEKCKDKLNYGLVKDIYDSDCYCDICGVVLSHKNDCVFHCDNTTHKLGYDICKNCGLEFIRDLLNNENDEFSINDKLEELNENSINEFKIKNFSINNNKIISKFNSLNNNKINKLNKLNNNMLVNRGASPTPHLPTQPPSPQSSSNNPSTASPTINTPSPQTTPSNPSTNTPPIRPSPQPTPNQPQLNPNSPTITPPIPPRFPTPDLAMGYHHIPQSPSPQTPNILNRASSAPKPSNIPPPPSTSLPTPPPRPIIQPTTDQAGNSPVGKQELLLHQKNDFECKILMNNLIDKKNNYKLLDDINGFYKKLFDKNDIKCLNGIICIRINDIWKVLIPPSLKNRIIVNIHDEILHHGYNKLVNKIRERYYWVGMFRDVKLFLKSCSVCQSNKTASKHFSKIKPIESKRFNDIISIDIEGPIRRSRSGKRYIVTIQDHYAKYLVMVPSSNIRTETIVRILVDNWIYVFGPPRSILSDRGTQFTSELYEILMKMYGIKINLTPPYHPSGNGGNERTHRWINNKLRNIISKNGNLSDWDLYIKMIEFGWNTTDTRSTGYAPYYVVYGFQPKLLVNNEIEKILEEIDPNEDPSLENYLKMKLKINNELYKNININKLNYNYKMRKDNNKLIRKEESFKIGDKILILNKRRFKKMDPLYLGPFIVKKLLGEYTLEYTDKEGATRVAHYNNIKKFIIKKELKENINKIRNKKDKFGLKDKKDERDDIKEESPPKDDSQAILDKGGGKDVIRI